MSGQKRRGRGQGNKNTPERIAAVKRRAEALTLRAYGASYEAIAQRLGFADASGAWRSVDEALFEVIEEPAKAVLKFELDRLDRMLVGVLPRAVMGHLGSIDRVLKIMERRARYLGLDTPLALTVDWRKEAEEAGLTPSQEFEFFVRQVMMDNAKRLGERTSGEPTRD